MIVLSNIRAKTSSFYTNVSFLILLIILSIFRAKISNFYTNVSLLILVIILSIFRTKISCFYTNVSSLVFDYDLSEPLDMQKKNKTGQKKEPCGSIYKNSYYITSLKTYGTSNK